MNDQQSATDQRIYRVEMGHCATVVQSESAERALDLARYHFMRELPRLWDVIQQLDPTRFRVTAM